MEGYRRVRVQSIKDMASYFRKMMRKGHVLVLVEYSNNEPDFPLMVKSHAIDKDRKSQIANCYISTGEESDCVITYDAWLYLAQRKEYDLFPEDENLDLRSDFANVISLGRHLADEVKHYSNTTFLLNETSYGRELYVSSGPGDIENMGGPLELSFAESWRDEKRSKREGETKSRRS